MCVLLRSSWRQLHVLVHRQSVPHRHTPASYLSFTGLTSKGLKDIARETRRDLTFAVLNVQTQLESVREPLAGNDRPRRFIIVIVRG